MVDHRRLGDVIRARKGSGGGRGAGRAHRDVWPLPSRHASRSAWGACASQPAALEAWRVLVWLITGKHGAENREPATCRIAAETTPDSHFALPVPSSTLFNAATQAAQMDGVHGGESAQEGCARPGSPPAPIRAPGGDRTRRFLHRDRLRHCIGRQVERITLKRAAVRRHASVRDHDRWYARPARSSPMSRALDDGDSLERR